MDSNDDNKHVMFVCEENEEHALLAGRLFAEAATTSDLAWTAIPWDSSKNDFEHTALIVSLSTTKQPSPLLQKLSNHKERVEYWHGNLTQDFIEVQIKNLVVRLILKGGKRKSLETQERCKTCLKLSNACVCTTPKTPDNKKKKLDTIRICLERKGRGGKAVTVASGFTLEASKLEELLSSLKRQCGSGGTIKDDQIEIQGDQRSRLISELEKLGYKCKKVGG